MNRRSEWATEAILGCLGAGVLNGVLGLGLGIGEEKSRRVLALLVGVRAWRTVFFFIFWSKEIF